MKSRLSHPDRQDLEQRLNRLTVCSARTKRKDHYHPSTKSIKTSLIVRLNQEASIKRGSRDKELFFCKTA